MDLIAGRGNIVKLNQQLTNPDERDKCLTDHFLAKETRR
jgi:hypothetical protein